ncbi:MULTISPECIES: T9SS type A sorting domain-containing protein [unclassified Imperialibacter]|uniref:T9SS type A sorting domain-containing protein n=1 Tax=unclassified Imperialibacter TaxID=2629706 RepID=UPI001256D96B|nr:MULTISPECIES: T9SS type A sorting domain-containing protein [unclassified Imperialibacter]CAD5291016.1 Por secretion system C-terminal sorting domain-containing protein [Imperialibacter sp. 89]CAD5291240.1 Por secretion system C-terminal sorting domain-containing protein [Imperialibacter sp. 75]VVT34404.1 Por secretion system C-terminal sorting domain-containing protein [Imperialibacter sp. EC-SDR9]
MRFIKFVIGLLLVALLGVNGYAQSTEDKEQVTTESAFRQTPTLELKNQIEVYPNPAVEFIVVEIKDSNLKKVEFEMHSIIGNTIRIEPEEVAKDTYKIPVKTFNSGYYFLIIKDDYTRYKKAIKFLKN